MSEFAGYYERTWIGTSTTPPKFSPWIWNHFESCQAGIPRTTNIAEGFHNGFRSLLQCTNPTLWKFLDKLKLEQALTDAKMTKKQMREAPARRERKCIQLDDRIQQFVDHYETMDYLKFLGNLIC